MIWPDDDPKQKVKPAPQIPPLSKAKLDIAIKERNHMAQSRFVANNKDVTAHTETQPAENYDANDRPWKRDNMTNLFKVYNDNDKSTVEQQRTILSVSSCQSLKDVNKWTF